MRSSVGREVVTRLAGFLILLIIPLLTVGVVFDPGLETRPDRFAESFARFVPQREQYLVGVGFIFAAGLVILPSGGALFLRFRPRGLNLATASSLGLLGAGFLVLGAAGAGLRVYDLATEWLALVGTVAEQVERSALTAQQLRFPLMVAVLGGAMAWSVIIPVRRMRQAMRTIASGDFSQRLEVDNHDELGALAADVNDTGQKLVTLQATVLAEERAHAAREHSARVTLAEEEERRRISRELHDDLGPSLAAIGNRLRTCQKQVRTDPAGMEKQLGEVADGIKGHIREIRELIYALRPQALDQLGVVGALSQLVEQFGTESGVRASFDSS